LRWQIRIGRPIQHPERVVSLAKNAVAFVRAIGRRILPCVLGPAGARDRKDQVRCAAKTQLGPGNCVVVRKSELIGRVEGSIRLEPDSTARGISGYGHAAERPDGCVAANGPVCRGFDGAPAIAKRCRVGKIENVGVHRGNRSQL